MVFNEKKYSFYHPENLIVESLNTLVNNSKENLIEVYVHNLNFDGFILIWELSKNLITYNIVSLKTNLYSIKINYCNKKIIFKCSFKIIPLSLKKLGEIENFPKGSLPYKFVNKNRLNYVGETPKIEYWNSEEDFSNFPKKEVFNLKKETIDYCLNDVILTQKVLSNIFSIIEKEDKLIQKKSFSAPGIAHKLFFKKYNNFKIEENLSIELDSFIRRAYFGGRCEVFGNPKNNEIIKYYDFSGMYGQCMLENFHIGKGSFEKSSKIEKPGFYAIEYESNFENIPILPQHHLNKLVFPNGRLSGIFWYEEIILFKKLGGVILEVKTSVTYEKNGEAFKDFVKNYDTIKKKGGYFKIFGKLMINSLYGSMGLRPEESIVYTSFSEEEFLNISQKTNVEKINKINNCFIIVIKNDFKSKHFFKNFNNQKNLSKNEVMLKTKRNVSYAAAISSKARVKLYNAFKEVEKNGGRLLYCDTDSIFASYKKNFIYPETKEIKWLNYYDDGVFILPKTYAIKNKKEEIIKLKGVKNEGFSF